MAPRSGWWQCVSEQGSRLVCWLEAIRVLATAKPARDCLFVASSGHELGFLGIEPYLNRGSDLIKSAHAWIFFGSDIGSPGQRNRIHASDDALEQWGLATMQREKLAVNTKVPHTANARGRPALFNEAEVAISLWYVGAMSTTAPRTGGRMRSTLVCWPGMPKRLRMERSNWRTKAVYQDRAGMALRCRVPDLFSCENVGKMMSHHAEVGPADSKKLTGSAEKTVLLYDKQ